MYRWVGAALVLGAAGWIGWAEGAVRHRRAALLRELISSLDRMEEELTFRLTPLPELFSHLAHGVSEPLAGFYNACAGYARFSGETLGDCWNREIEKLSEDLDAFSMESLQRLGKGLGRYGEEGERNLLRHTAEELRVHLSEVETAAQRQGKLCCTMGFMAGTFLILVLI